MTGIDPGAEFEVTVRHDGDTLALADGEVVEKSRRPLRTREPERALPASSASTPSDVGSAPKNSGF